MASKSPQAFRTIREVADWLGIEAHVLRFWESKFSQIKPVKRAGGRRYYRPADMQLVGGIKVLLHDQGLTIRGVQKLIREDGTGHVAALSPPLEDGLQSGEVIEAEATIPEPAQPSEPEPAAGFFDFDAVAQDDPPIAAADLPPQNDAAALRPPADSVAADAPALEAALSATPAPETGADVEPLSALYALIARAGTLSATQIAELTPHVARLQGLSDRLTAKSRAS